MAFLYQKAMTLYHNLMLVDTKKLAALSRVQLLNCFADVQYIAILLFHFNFGSNLHP